MTIKVWLSILLPVILLIVLLFGFSTVSPDQKKLLDETRIETVYIDRQLEIRKGMETLANSDLQTVERLNAAYSAADSIEKVSYLKDLSSFWFQQQKLLLAGLYAEEVATLMQTDTAWSIAGTTYIYGLRQAEAEAEQRIFFEKSIEMLENAISLAPKELSHRINLANAYIAKPPADNPMKGILLLRNLLENNPTDIRVLARLAELSIETGQYENAKNRLFEALDHEPESQRILCLLSKLASITQDEELLDYVQRCDQLLIK